MGQFGQQLRQERESRGIALENITGVTKICGRHLLALENENFEALPGGVLSKGIVRGYARVVGLDEDAWVNRYLAAYNHSGQLKDDDVSWMEFAENVGRARKGDRNSRAQRMRWAGVAVLLTMLGLFTWYVAHFVNTRAALATEDLRPHVAGLKVPPPATALLQHRSRPALVTPPAALESEIAPKDLQAAPAKEGATPTADEATLPAVEPPATAAALTGAPLHSTDSPATSPQP